MYQCISELINFFHERELIMYNQDTLWKCIT